MSPLTGRRGTRPWEERESGEGRRFGRFSVEIAEDSEGGVYTGRSGESDLGVWLPPGTVSKAGDVSLVIHAAEVDRAQSLEQRGWCHVIEWQHAIRGN